MSGPDPRRRVDCSVCGASIPHHAAVPIDGSNSPSWWAKPTFSCPRCYNEARALHSLQHDGGRAFFAVDRQPYVPYGKKPPTG